MKNFLCTIGLQLQACEQATPAEQPELIPVSTEATNNNQRRSLWEPTQLQRPTFLTTEMLTQISKEDWNSLYTVTNSTKFTTSESAEIFKVWVAIRSNHTKDALSSLQRVQTHPAIPTNYRSFMLGMLYLAQKDITAARTHFQSIATDSSLATEGQWALIQYQLSELKEGTQPTPELITEIQQFVDGSHPMPKGDEALLTLAKNARTDAEKYPYLRELWASYPYSKVTFDTSAKLNAIEKSNAKYKPNSADWNKRSTQMMEAWQWKQVTTELAPIVANLNMTDADSCAVRYAYGRSHFKINNVTKATEILPLVGKDCQKFNEDVGAKSWYIIGKSYERKKMWAEAANAFQQIPLLYPTHSMADDGYALAGIGYQEAGQMDKAMDLWRKQVLEYPDGDLIGEGYWRLAWSEFLEGDTATALQWVKDAQSVVPATGHPYQYFAFPYWEARWKVYPSNSDHGVQSNDTNRVAEGIDQWKDLVSKHPTEFYALLAAGQLWELDPTWMKEHKQTETAWQQPRLNQPWLVDNDYLAEPAYIEGQQLMALGLLKEGQESLATLKNRDLDAFVIYTQAVAQENWSTGHDILHKHIQHHPPNTWTHNQDALWYTTYPNQYWDILSAHSTQHPTDYPYDIRIFHALVREESSFNQDIVSWAGAKGLSQLMPATADRVAGWVGLSVNSTTIFDPSTNLRIGSKYLGYLHTYFKGNPYLAVAAYNAGEGNVGKWLSTKGNLPTDMFIESIPFRETRHYVKRVLGTYQSYHFLYDRTEDTPMFLDLHAYNHIAKPETL